jgi:hypothetical protein
LGVIQYSLEALRGDIMALGRMCAIVLGFMITLVGYSVGMIFHWKFVSNCPHPSVIKSLHTESNLVSSTIREEAEL